MGAVRGDREPQAALGQNVHERTQGQKRSASSDTKLARSGAPADLVDIVARGSGKALGISSSSDSNSESSSAYQSSQNTLLNLKE